MFCVRETIRPLPLSYHNLYSCALTNVGISAQNSAKPKFFFIRRNTFYYKSYFPKKQNVTKTGVFLTFCFSAITR